MFFVDLYWFHFTGFSVQVYADVNTTDITEHDETSQAFLFPTCIYLVVEVRLRLQFRCVQTSGSIHLYAGAVMCQPVLVLPQ